MTNMRTYQFGQSRLTIEFGDLITSTAQVLVSSDDYYLSMSGGVSASILRKGGQAIALDAAKKVPAVLGDIVVTTAGSLPAQYIFHAVTIGPSDLNVSPKEVIAQTTRRCMQILDALHLTSIAFPAIGAGAARFSYEDVAVQMAEVISDDLQKRQTPVDVALYLFDQRGRMTEIDFIRFFEEFAIRVPRFADHTVTHIAKPVNSISQQELNIEETDTQIKMRRYNNIRKLLSSLEDKRFDLEAELIELINSGQDEERANLRRKLDENQELRLGLLKELQSLSGKESANSENKLESKSEAMPRSKKKGKTEMTETYVDFDLHIAPNGHVIASSMEGQATAEISTQPPNDIQLALQLIEKRQTNIGLLKQIGQSLYSWLFPAPIHTHFQQTEAVARDKRSKVRLRLRIEAEEIAKLPVEFLYRTIGSYFFAVEPDTVLSRYLNLPLPQERVRRRKNPLHMLTVIADPIDQVRLPPDDWEVILKESLKEPLENGQLTLQTVKQATRREIQKALLAQEPDIIQFVGHGIYQDGAGYLALVDEKTEKTWRVSDEQFTSLFRGYDDHLGLICLATCESAKSDDPQGFLGIAPKLVQSGVPAVLSMQYKVYVATAKVFLGDFYKYVADRKPIDWATQQARNAISIECGLDNREFATPVLYMRAKDGNVFLVSVAC